VTLKKIVVSSLIAILALLSPAVGAPSTKPISVQAVGAVSTCSGGASGITVTELHGPVFYVEIDGSTPFTSQYVGYKFTNGASADAQSGLYMTLDTYSTGLRKGTYAADSVPLGALAAGASAKGYQYVARTGSATANVPAGAQSYRVVLWSGDPAASGAVPVCSYVDSFTSITDVSAASSNKVNSVSVDNLTPALGEQFTVTISGTTGTWPDDKPTSDPGGFASSPAVLDTWPASAYRLEAVSMVFTPSSITKNDYLWVNLGALNPTNNSPYTLTYTFRMTASPPGGSQGVIYPVQRIASGNAMKIDNSPPANTTLPSSPAQPPSFAMTKTTSTRSLPAAGGDVTYTVTLSASRDAAIDSLRDTFPSGATFKTGSASYDGVALADPVELTSGSAEHSFGGPFAVGSTPKTLTYTLTFGASPGVKQNTITALIGTTTLTATSDIEIAVGQPVALDTTLAATVGESYPITLPVDQSYDPSASIYFEILTDPSLGNLTGTGGIARSTELTARNASWSASTLTQPTQAFIASVVSGTSFTYTPTSAGDDSFTYRACDASTSTCGAIEGTSLITVTAAPDSTPPTASWSGTPDSPASAGPLAWTLTFSEAVSGLAAADITNVGSATCATPVISDGPTVYTVTYSTCTVDGTLQPRLAASSVTDTATNSGPASTVTATSITFDRSVTTKFVGPGGGSDQCATPTYSTIAAAVATISDDGWTIFICNATYVFTTPVVLSYNMTLQGQSRDGVILDGAASSSSFFNVIGSKQVLFSTMTMQNGTPQTHGGSDREGGAIWAGDASSLVSIYAVVIKDCGSLEIGRYGGAIYSYGNVNIEQSVFSGNKAHDGGALNVNGTLNIIGSEFSGNSSIRYGGAMNVGAATVSGTILTLNSAGNGGAINGGSVTVEDSDFVTNTASHGGAISAAAVVVVDSTFDGNVSSEGRDLFFATSSSVSGIRTSRLGSSRAIQMWQDGAVTPLTVTIGTYSSGLHGISGTVNTVQSASSTVLSAVPDEGYVTLWGGACSAASGDTCTLSGAGAKIVAVSFVLSRSITAVATPSSVTYAGLDLEVALSLATHVGAGAVTYTQISGDCEVSGTTATITGGTTNCVVEASIAADADYAAATDQVTITVGLALTGTVTYDPNGGVCTAADQSGEDGDVISSTCTKAEYRFRGWSTTDDQSVEYRNGDEFNFSTYDGETLYAVYRRSGSSGTPSGIITYSPNSVDGTCTATTQRGTADDVINASCARIGYDFLGWTLFATSPVSYLDGAVFDFVLHDGATLYAVWSLQSTQVGAPKLVVYFSPGGAKLSAAAKEKIKLFVSELQAGSYSKIVIRGYMNPVPGVPGVGFKRAARVQRYLEKLGVTGVFVITEQLGTSPIGSKNRKAVVRFILE
jgi:hypothetical protein